MSMAWSMSGTSWVDKMSEKRLVLVALTCRFFGFRKGLKITTTIITTNLANDVVDPNDAGSKAHSIRKFRLISAEAVHIHKKRFRRVDWGQLLFFGKGARGHQQVVRVNDNVHHSLDQDIIERNLISHLGGGRCDLLD